MDAKHQKFALASAGVMSAVYLLCALIVLTVPEFALQLFGWLVHIVNVEKFAGDVRITFGGILGGLFQTFVYTYALAWIFAWLHGRFLAEEARTGARIH